MPILENNIKFVESQVMDDVPEGGGASTGNVIVDGQMNNIYEDVSDLDRALGRFSMRKIYLAIKTLSTDLFGGAKTAITALPVDDAISYALFSTGDPFDTRSAAINRVEAYLYKGPMWGGYLLENHIAGMRAINVIQRVGSAIAPIGKTLCLVANEGLPTETEQYVRVIGLSVVQRDFVDGVLGDGSDAIFTRWVVTMAISDPLRHDFIGHTPNRRDQEYVFTSGKTRVRDTTVADAMRFYGSQWVTHAADVGDRTIRARSIYAQLVPASRSETALVDQSYAAEFQHTLATTPRAVVVNAAPLSVRYKITAENRGYNYTAILKPLPAPGSVRVVYRAQGNTYSITDTGAGTLEGSGGGSVSYITGSMVVTLEALPDVGSAVVIYYGPNRAYTNRSGSVGFRPPAVRFTLEHPNIDPGTFTVGWSSGGNAKEATDNGFGVITGDADGVIVYATGEVWMQPTAFPDGGSQYAIDYEHTPAEEEAFPGLTPDSAGFVSFELAESPVPGSLEISWAVSRVTAISSGVESSAAATARNASTESIALPTPRPGTIYTAFVG
ncbi:MAG: hypothetical protein JNK52_12175 [Zoogloeaceae bacterium]|nr:hypothetical protein [Zoogloeaceae bacterium]